MGKPRILLADGHSAAVESFRKLETDIEVLGNVSDSGSLLSAARRLKPDVVIIDLGMEMLDGTTTGQEIRRRLPQSKLIVLTPDDNYQPAVAALRTWASGCLLNKSTGSELAKAIREVLKGKSYVTPKVARQLLDTFVGEPQSGRTKSLTPRQREVLQLLAEGRTMKQAAAILHLATRTIAFHKYRIMDEFGLKTNSDFIRFAIREHVLT